MELGFVGAVTTGVRRARRDGGGGLGERRRMRLERGSVGRGVERRVRSVAGCWMRAVGEQNHGDGLSSFFYWDGCPTFIKCPECKAVFALESEEIGGQPRWMLCSVCLHEWRATEREIIWGEDAAIQQIRNSPPMPTRKRPRTRSATRCETSMSVFVGGLSYACSEDDLFSAFSSFGEVLRCQIPHKAGVPRGIGFVEFKQREDALRAIEILDGTCVLGRKISLSIANTDSKEFEDDDPDVTQNNDTSLRRTQEASRGDGAVDEDDGSCEDVDVDIVDMEGGEQDDVHVDVDAHGGDEGMEEDGMDEDELSDMDDEDEDSQLITDNGTSVNLSTNR